MQIYHVLVAITSEERIKSKFTKTFYNEKVIYTYRKRVLMYRLNCINTTNKSSVFVKVKSFYFTFI